MLTLAGVDQMSDDKWAACDQCAKLVDEGRWEELAQRSIDKFPLTLGSAERGEYLAMLRDVHQRFRASMTQQKQDH
jgi:hypothetical protein